MVGGGGGGGGMGGWELKKFRNIFCHYGYIQTTLTSLNAQGVCSKPGVNPNQYGTLIRAPAKIGKIRCQKSKVFACGGLCNFAYCVISVC